MTSTPAEHLSRLARRDSATLDAANIRNLSARINSAAQGAFGQHLRAVSLIDKHVHSLFNRANSGLAREVRYLATSLKPSVRQAAVILCVPTADPLTTWQAPFSELVGYVEDVAIPDHGISRFYGEVIGGNPAADAG